MDTKRISGIRRINGNMPGQKTHESQAVKGFHPGGEDKVEKPGDLRKTDQVGLTNELKEEMDQEKAEKAKKDDEIQKPPNENETEAEKEEKLKEKQKELEEIQEKINENKEKLNEANQKGDFKEMASLTKELGQLNNEAKALEEEIANLQQGMANTPQSSGGNTGGGTPATSGVSPAYGGGTPAASGGGTPAYGGGVPTQGGTSVPQTGNTGTGNTARNNTTEKSSTANPTTPTNLKGDDKKTAEFINDYLAKKDSPAAGKGAGEMMVEAGKKYNVDPLVLLSIAGHETGFGKLGVGMNKMLGVGAYDSNPNGKTPYDGLENQIYSGAKTFSNLRSKGGSSADAGIADQLAAANKAGWATDQGWAGKVANWYQKIAADA